jgi:hypothetical protein
VVLRPGDQTLNPGHDNLTMQRFPSHLATRLITVSQTRPEEASIHQSSTAAAICNYQHSSSETGHPSAGISNDNHQQQLSQSKYSEQTSGHDSLSDYVSFACQEPEHHQNTQGSQVRIKKSNSE